MHSAIETNDPWLRVSDIARDLSYHPSTVRDWFEKGLLPGQEKPHGRWQIRLSNYNKWKESRRQPAPVAPEATQ